MFVAGEYQQLVPAPAKSRSNSAASVVRCASKFTSTSSKITGSSMPRRLYQPTSQPQAEEQLLARAAAEHLDRQGMSLGILNAQDIQVERSPHAPITPVG